MSKRMIIMLATSALFFGSIVAYLIFKSHMISYHMKSMGMPVITVSAMPVPLASWQPKIVAVGTLNAVNGVDVTTEIAGIVDSIPFIAGAQVKKGDVLVELNADVEIAQLQSLEALAELAQITYTRDQKQLAVQAVSQSTVDVDEADLKSKKAQVAQQAAIVAKKKIEAPFAGRLGISNINEGQYLKPGDKIVTLQALNPIFVNYFLPQQDLPTISVGQEIAFTTDTYPKTIFKGKITTINPKVDPATRNVEVEATLLNPENKLLPGMFGQVEINTGNPKNFLTLPQTAITYNPYGDLVYILKEKEKDKSGNQVYVANQKFVTLGETRGDQVQVLTGLEANDLVVTSGQMKLKNGSLVIINNAVVPGNNPNPILKNSGTNHSSTTLHNCATPAGVILESAQRESGIQDNNSLRKQCNMFFYIRKSYIPNGINYLHWIPAFAGMTPIVVTPVENS